MSNKQLTSVTAQGSADNATTATKAVTAAVKAKYHLAVEPKASAAAVKTGEDVTFT